MLKAYLAGPMEYEADHGRGWREELMPELLKLGIIPIDPTLGGEPGHQTRIIDTESSALSQAKASHDWPKFTELMHRVWVNDKKWVDSADFLIVYCRGTDNLSGTIREMQEAYEYGKPIFLIVSGDPAQLKSHTLYMALRRGKIFVAFDEFLSYFKNYLAEHGEAAIKDHEPDLFQVSQKVLIIKDSRELLILKDCHHPTHFDLPGGRLNVNEFTISLEESVAREITEELGSDIKLKINYQPVVAGRVVLWDPRINDWHYRRVFFVCYEAQYLGGEIVLSEEHVSYQWVDVKKFDPTGRFKPGLAEAIKSYLLCKK